MRSPRLLLLALACSAGSLFAAAPEAPAPELRGVLSLGGQQRFSLSDAGATQTGWLSLGEEFSGWKLVSYKATEETLVLSKDGHEITLHLLSSAVKNGDVASTKATLADADAVIRKLNLEGMIRKSVEQQKKLAVQMAKQMAAKAGGEVDEAALSAFQEKVMGLLFNDEMIKGMSDDMTRIYSEVFSKEELQGLSDFYSTTTGQAMVDRTPVIQEKLMQSMMPRMMANMGKVQALGAEFARQQAEKAAAKHQAAQPAAPEATQPAATTGK